MQCNDELLEAVQFNFDALPRPCLGFVVGKVQYRNQELRWIVLYGQLHACLDHEVCTSNECDHYPRLRRCEVMGEESGIPPTARYRPVGGW